jgi:hypothetical protein
MCMAKSGLRDREPHTPERPPPPAPDQRRLPAARAFVVQLPDGDLGGGPLSGRVEHVLTGRSTRFEGLEHLARFFGEVLAAAEGGAVAGTGEPAANSSDAEAEDD